MTRLLPMQSPRNFDKGKANEPDASGEDGDAADLPPPRVKVGDYVQWTSGGVDQFKPPRQVLEILPDGLHARVFGSPVGLAMSELTVVEPNKAPVKEPVVASSAYRADNEELKSDISVLMRGKHLEIMATWMRGD